MHEVQFRIKIVAIVAAFWTCRDALDMYFILRRKVKPSIRQRNFTSKPVADKDFTSSDRFSESDKYDHIAQNACKHRQEDNNVEDPCRVLFLGS